MALGMMVVSAAGACTGGKHTGVAGPTAKLAVVPANGTTDVPPDGPVTVRATDGKIQNVTVTTKGAKVEGAMTPDATQWQSRWALEPATDYHVLVTALGLDGKTKTVTSDFTTLKAKKVIQAAVVAPDQGEKVGVGMPVILHFDKPVANREQVEKNLEVRSTVPVVGAWHWLDSQSLVWRTKKYWPANTKVRVIGHLTGARAAKDSYLAKNIDLNFRIGDSHITVASSKNHHQVIKKNGKVIKEMPLSMGKGGIRKYTTTNGLHLTMGKEYLTVMDSTTTGCGPGCPDYYREDVYWTVRISDSGEYEHSAPWSVGSQGSENVSHGCINLSPANAIWFYHFSYRGDIVQVTGTDRELEPGNGWGYWQETWKEWLRYSALKRPVTTAALDGTSVLAAAPGDTSGEPSAPAATPGASGTPGATPSPSVTATPSASPARS
ncbi:Ig-like domain-containing protein [Actinomadura scrupuli]|uniref:L,D-transpeptidase n=1 Tax=Actinomadura scrupuli TaxID=559629 RepID=UPI003D981B1A